MPTVGFFPNVIRAIEVHSDHTTKFIQSDGQEVALHPSSLLSSRVATLISETAYDAFLIYYLKVSYMGRQ
jgi:hypothetical protein